MRQFQPEFDLVAMILTLIAFSVLLFSGLAQPQLFRDLWVAYAMFSAGFFGSFALGLVTPPQKMMLGNMLQIVFYATIGVVAIFVIQLSYGIFAPGSGLGELLVKPLEFSIGVAEELFFGVLLLGILVRMVMLDPVLSVLITSGVHTAFHIPNWGQSPMLLLMFFGCFTGMRLIYVLFYHKVGVLLLAHGGWNFLSNGG